MKKQFFLHDRTFYRKFFSMMLVLVLQNIIIYTVNVADNIMLGAYSQQALAAAAAVNQIQYLLQQFTVMGLGEGLIIMSSQFWGRKDTDAIQAIAGTAVVVGVTAGLALTGTAFLVPEKMVGLFTEDAAIVAEGVRYLSGIRYTYVIFIVINLLLSTLRSVQVVRIAFAVSCTELVINASINYCLIYGRFGLPEMGIRGAAFGTLAANIVGLCVVVLYCQKNTALPMRLSLTKMFRLTGALLGKYLRISVPCVVSSVVFASAGVIQTVIFGHISGDALAASGVAGTFFQYIRMIPIGTAAAACVLIGEAVGSGKTEELRQMVHTLQGIFLGVGCVIGLLLLSLRYPVLSMYKLTDTAYTYAMTQMTIQSVVMVALALQMPEQVGIIRGGGDTRYSMISDVIYSWILVIPIGLLGCFVWHWPFWMIVSWLNIDQFLKCITVTIKVRSYTWVKKLT